MADLVIKPAPSTGNKLILQTQNETAVLTTSDAGVDSATSIVATKTGTETLTNKTLTAPTVADMSNFTFPAFTKSFFIKGWVTFNQSSNTILSSYNVDTISHPATGRTIINWDTDFGSANYAISGMASDSTNPLLMTLYNASGAITSSSVQIMVQYQNFNLADATFVSVMAIGD